MLKYLCWHLQNSAVCSRLLCSAVGLTLPCGCLQAFEDYPSQTALNKGPHGLKESPTLPTPIQSTHRAYCSTVKHTISPSASLHPSESKPLSVLSGPLDESDSWSTSSILFSLWHLRLMFQRIIVVSGLKSFNDFPLCLK